MAKPSLASVAMPDDSTMDDVDDAPMEETGDMAAAAEDVLSAIEANDAGALKSALESFVLSVK